MKALILVSLFALAHTAGAAEPVKCTSKSCVSNTESQAASSRSGTLRPPQSRHTPLVYSDEPLPPAPGMKTWRPQQQKTAKIEKARATAVQQSFVAEDQEFRRM